MGQAAGALPLHHLRALHFEKTHLETQKTQITPKNRVTEIIKGCSFQWENEYKVLSFLCKLYSPQICMMDCIMQFNVSSSEISPGYALLLKATRAKHLSARRSPALQDVGWVVRTELPCREDKAEISPFLAWLPQEITCRQLPCVHVDGCVSLINRELIC